MLDQVVEKDEIPKNYDKYVMNEGTNFGLFLPHIWALNRLKSVDPSEASRLAEAKEAQSFL